MPDTGSKHTAFFLQRFGQRSTTGGQRRRGRWSNWSQPRTYLLSQPTQSPACHPGRRPRPSPESRPGLGPQTSLLILWGPKRQGPGCSHSRTSSLVLTRPSQRIFFSQSQPPGPDVDERSSPGEVWPHCGGLWVHSLGGKSVTTSRLDLQTLATRTELSPKLNLQYIPRHFFISIKPELDQSFGGGKLNWLNIRSIKAAKWEAWLNLLVLYIRVNPLNFWAFKKKSHCMSRFLYKDIIFNNKGEFCCGFL